MRRERRVYENGYWPKIKYWSGLLQAAIEQDDITGAGLCSSKLEYFTGKQKELEGDLKEV